MNILAIDLGTTTGWALHAGGKITSGSKSCAVGTLEGRGQRWLKFRALLAELSTQAGDIHAVYFEHVKRHEGVQAAHIYGGFLANLEAWCELRRIPMMKTDVGIVKKNWTGNGAAKKDEMVAAAKARGFRPADDNEADALAILSLALVREKLQRIEPPAAPLFQGEAA